MALALYNLFPRYYEGCAPWAETFPHIKGLGFNAIYLNPFHYPGFSGSLYAPKDYYSLNPICYDAAASEEPLDQLAAVLQKAHACGLKVIMDLVINHTSKDHPFIKQHPSWYARDHQGGLVSPGAWENGGWVSWGDLAQLDNISSPDKESLWAYWEDLIVFYTKLGFDGFRADAAYQIPSALWQRLIQRGRGLNPEALFLAESLGCTPEQSIELSRAGFDYLFNSAKWWDFTQPWFIDQHNAISVPTIAFPESHDTQRIAGQYNADEARIRQIIGFTGLISSAWMIISGTEWGWQQKTDVVNTTPKDKEPIRLNLQSYVASINTLRQNNTLLNQEGALQARDHENRGTVLALEKTFAHSQEGFFYLINKSGLASQFTTFNLNDFLSANQCSLIFSSEGDSTQNPAQIPLKPWEFKLFSFRKRP